jgi:hypothetical protein
MYQIDISILEAERRVASLVRWLMCWLELKNEKEKNERRLFCHISISAYHKHKS